MFTRLWLLIIKTVLKFWIAVSIHFSGVKSDKIFEVHSVKDILKYVLGNAVKERTQKEASKRVRIFSDLFLKFKS